jgi:putative addiction module killer protein
VRILEYNGPDGHSPFRAWFDALDPVAAAKVTVAVMRMELGNLSNAKSVGLGVSEFKIDFGPGYRIYFGKDGSEIVILLGGGSKKRQQRDVAKAAARWADYKERKRSQQWR